MTSEVAIHAQNLSKVYRLYNKPIDRLKEALHPLRKSYHHTFSALDDVSFDVLRGETVGIIGKNGAGKSTLLKMIAGVITPTTGSVSVKGRISSLLELGTGFNPELSGVENVFFNGMLLDIPREVLEERLESIIAFADIGHFIERPVKIYSSGMFARLALAVAFHVDPEILIVDETLSVGDVAFQKKCFDKFNAIRDQGCTILFVSHDPYQIKGYCQRALYLKNGVLEKFGESSDVVDLYTYDQEKAIAEQSLPSTAAANTAESQGNLSLRITDVALLNEKEEEIKEVTTGETVKIRFRYKTLGQFNGKISFVFNLYRHDDFYVCGATSVMDSQPAYEVFDNGEVTVTFRNFQALSGRYKWRVAINDEKGLGIYTEAVPVCEFAVRDSFESVGLVHLEREWHVKAA